MLKFYIDGEWVEPVTANPVDVINPATDKPCGRISLGSAADVDRGIFHSERCYKTRLPVFKEVLALFNNGNAIRFPQT